MSIIQTVRKSMMVEENTWFRLSLHLVKMFVSISLCNCHKLYCDVVSLWFHENETDPGVFLGTHLSQVQCLPIRPGKHQTISV